MAIIISAEIRTFSRFLQGCKYHCRVRMMDGSRGSLQRNPADPSANLVCVQTDDSASLFQVCSPPGRGALHTPHGFPNVQLSPSTPLLAVSSWLHRCWFMTNQPRSSWKLLCAAGFRHCLLCPEWPSRQTTTHELKSFPAALNTHEPRRGSSGFPSKALPLY